nr:NAD(+)/NADH kinase [Lachnoclostridium sp. Marseille-P6806]
MEEFFIITNTNKDPELWYQRRIADFLEARGKRCRFACETPDGAKKSPGDHTDCILVLGGDGTMLQAARENVDRGVPLLGINLGTLGYLAEIEKNGWEQALRQLLSGDYLIEERMMLEGVVNGESRADHALNDVAITRFGSLQMVSYAIYVNGQYLNTFQADGVIVSTPTGSTGYNMSAGGPIVEPSARALLLTPICPHTLNARSIVLSAEDVISIVIGQSREGENAQVEVDFDGSGSRRIVHPGDEIRVCRDRRTVRIVKLSQRSFLETLHRKMTG